MPSAEFDIRRAVMTGAYDGFDVGVAGEGDDIASTGVGDVELVGELSVIAAYSVGEAGGNGNRDRYRHGKASFPDSPGGRRQLFH